MSLKSVVIQLAKKIGFTSKVSPRRLIRWGWIFSTSKIRPAVIEVASISVVKSASATDQGFGVD
jgi:hypothetical protein